MGFSVFPSEGGFNDYKTPTVKHSLNSSGNISVPSGTNMAYAIVINGGQGGNGGGWTWNGEQHHFFSGSSGQAGQINFGLTPITTSVTVGGGGAGGNNTGSSQTQGNGNAGSVGGVSSFGAIGFDNDTNSRNPYTRNAGSQNNPTLYGLGANAGAPGGATSAGTAGGVAIIY
jgi:hypothetical protein